jgi:hypothetical protein
MIDGWRYSTGVKNIAKRLSPALAEWKKLPESEREKDRDAVRNIPRLLQWIESQQQSSE